MYRERPNPCVVSRVARRCGPLPASCRLCSRRNRMRFIMEHSSVTLLYSYLIYAGPYVDDPPIDTPNYRHGFSARFYSPGALRSMESFRYLPLCLSILERLCIKDVHQKFCIMDHLPFLLQVLCALAAGLSRDDTKSKA